MTIQASDFEQVQSDPWPEWVNAKGWRLCGRPGQSLDDLLIEINQAPPPTVETPELVPVLSDYTSAIAAMMDAKAVDRRYESALSLATYLGSTNAQWAAEAQAFVAWRDQVWAYCYAEVDKVQAGERPQPTISEFLTELETQFPLTWPQ